MSGVTFGKETRVKLLGGALIIRQAGTSGPDQKLKLTGIKRRAHDLREPFEAFQPVWFASEAATFAAGGRPDAWPALSPAYQQWKDRAYPGQGIMVLTGRLSGSLTSMTGDTAWSVGPRTLRFGTRVPYWHRHQVGFRMPRRATLVLQDADKKQLRDMVRAYIIGKGQA